jgi:hypothetical protein
MMQDGGDFWKYHAVRDKDLRAEQLLDCLGSLVVLGNRVIEVFYH